MSRSMSGSVHIRHLCGRRAVADADRRGGAPCPDRSRERVGTLSESGCAQRGQRALTVPLSEKENREDTIECSFLFLYKLI